MSKTVQAAHNFRVVVEPDLIYRPDDSNNTAARIDGLNRDCREILAAIRRHVDGIASVRIEYDEPPVCSYCGAHWTERSPTYNGGCCDEDEANNPNPEQAP